MLSLVVPSGSPSTSTTGTPPATSSSTPCSTKRCRLSSLTRALTLKPSSCMSAWLALLFSCSFLALTFSQARRLADPRRWWRPELKETMELTTNGFPSQRCATPLPAAKPPQGSVKIRLVLTLTKEEDVSELQRPTPSDPDASHHLDYLQQTGHCILITDFSFFSFDTLSKIC